MLATFLLPNDVPILVVRCVIAVKFVFSRGDLFGLSHNGMCRELVEDCMGSS